MTIKFDDGCVVKATNLMHDDELPTVVYALTYNNVYYLLRVDFNNCAHLCTPDLEFEESNIDELLELDGTTIYFDNIVEKAKAQRDA